MLEEHPEIELMLTEAQLRGEVDGLELARRVSRDRPDVRLVVTCAGKDVESHGIPQSARMLRKPYASGELRNLVDARVARS